MAHHEFTVSGIAYRSGGIDPVSTTHLARRLMPFIAALIPLLSQHVAGLPLVGGAQSLSATLDRAKPLTDFLSTMDDETHDFVFDRALAKVERERPDGRWERIWDVKRRMLVVEGVSAADLVEIVVNVLTADLAPFFYSLIDRMPKPVAGTGTKVHLHG